MSTSYTNVFGGENVNPADLSYKAYTISASIELRWPFEALDGSLVVADKMDVQATANGLAVTLPDATLASVGEDVLWNNVGSRSITIRRNDGTAIATILSGTRWYTYLIDNSTVGGSWRAVQMGATTSSANAAALAGYGLRATETAKLDQNLLTNGVVADIDLTHASRAQVFRHTGGAVTHTIAAAATLGPPPNSNNGWFAIEINSGDGNVQVTPQAGELIDGAPFKELGPGESCVVYCFGSGFVTMGHNQLQSSAVTGLVIDTTGTGDLVLDNVQLAAQIQNYGGAPTLPRTLVYGPGSGYWFVYNNTAQPLQVKGSVIDTPITLLASTFSILRSLNGILDVAFSAATGTVTSITGVADQIVTTPSPLVATGTVGLATMATLTVGTYGGPISPIIEPPITKVPQITFDNKGRATVAENLDILIESSQINDLDATISAILPPGVMLQFGGISLPPAPPSGKRAWLLCDGSMVSKTTYPELWAAIAQTYGVATGSPPTGATGNFKLPDTRGRVLAGADESPVADGGTGVAGKLTVAGLGANAIVAAVGGLEIVTLTELQMPSHNHTVVSNITITDPGHTHVFHKSNGEVTVPNSINSFDSAIALGQVSGLGGYIIAANMQSKTTGITAASGNVVGMTGGSTSHTNVQPTLVVRHIIKT